MSPEKKLLIKFFFFAVAGLAVVVAIYSLVVHPGAGSDIVSTQAAELGQSVQAIPVEGWAWALSTDTSTVPQLGINMRINASGTLEFLNVVPNAGNPAGPGWIALTHTTSTPRLGSSTLPANYYGLTFYMTNNFTGAGYFEGYIWSPNFGWIQFATSTASGCPSGSCAATVDDAGKAHGWARILSIPQAGSDNPPPVKLGDPPLCGDAGGWAPNDCYKGWVRLGSESGDRVSYGLRIQGDGSLTGYAWSNEFGWFGFMGRAARPIVGGSRASCSLWADPRSVKVTRTAIATTSISWACVYTNDDCRLFRSKGIPVSVRVATSSSGRVESLHETTVYSIECTSAVSNPPLGSPVKANDTVTARYPSQIIECNPNSPNCK